VTDKAIVRFGTLGEVGRIMPVMQRAFDPAYGEAWTQQQCTGLLTLPGTAMFLAEEQDQVIGFSLVRHVLYEAELLMIAVDPSRQKAGIGRLLLNAVIDWTKKSGAEQVFLEVRSGNPALELYRNADFVQCGLRKCYYRGNNGTISDALTLVRSLGK
jgi:ribosomal-protein-alanine N-acetyltransferase